MLFRNTSFSKEVKWTPSHKIVPGFLTLSVANGKNRLNIGSHQTADKALSISAGWPDLHQHRWRYYTFSSKWNCLIIPQMRNVEIRFPDRFYRYSHDKLEQTLLLLFLLSLFNEGVTKKIRQRTTTITNNQSITSILRRKGANLAKVCIRYIDN